MNEDNTRKMCTGCGVEKLITEFTRCRSSADNLQSHCKACVRERDQQLDESTIKERARIETTQLEAQKAEDRRIAQRANRQRRKYAKRLNDRETQRHAMQSRLVELGLVD